MRVYRSSGKGNFAHVSKSAQGRFTRDGGRSRGVFQQKFKLDYGKHAIDCEFSDIFVIPA